MKDKTRAKRSFTADAKEYKLYPEMKLTMSMKHRHEEADTLIPQQVIASADEDPSKEIHVSCQNMDVFTYLLDL